MAMADFFQFLQSDCPAIQAFVEEHEINPLMTIKGTQNNQTEIASLIFGVYR
jgi:hypothetical protein